MCMQYKAAYVYYPKKNTFIRSFVFNAACSIYNQTSKQDEKKKKIFLFHSLRQTLFLLYIFFKHKKKRNSFSLCYPDSQGLSSSSPSFVVCITCTFHFPILSLQYYISHIIILLFWIHIQLILLYDINDFKCFIRYFLHRC